MNTQDWSGCDCTCECNMMITDQGICCINHQRKWKFFDWNDVDEISIITKLEGSLKHTLLCIKTKDTLFTSLLGSC